MNPSYFIYHLIILGNVYASFDTFLLAGSHDSSVALRLVGIACWMHVAPSLHCNLILISSLLLHLPNSSAPVLPSSISGGFYCHVLTTQRQAFRHKHQPTALLLSCDWGGTILTNSKIYTPSPPLAKKKKKTSKHNHLWAHQRRSMNHT